jgi:hypothetical protein
MELSVVDMVLQTVQWMLSPDWSKYILNRVRELRNDRYSNDIIHPTIDPSRTSAANRELYVDMIVLQRLETHKDNISGLKRIFEAKIGRELERRFKENENKTDVKRTIKVFIKPLIHGQIFNTWFSN